MVSSSRKAKGGKITMIECRFTDCRHRWVPRSANPDMCPKCQRSQS